MKKNFIVFVVVVLITILATGTALAAQVFVDYFSRSNSSTVGNGWSEYEKSGNSAFIESYELGLESDNDQNGVSVTQDFTGTSTDAVEVELDAFLNRTGEENTYYVYFQLGDESAMTDGGGNGDEIDGIAAHLVWRNYGSHEKFVAYDGSTAKSCMVADGDIEIRLYADMATDTWDVYITELVPGGPPDECSLTGLDFRTSVSEIDAFRIQLDEIYTPYFDDLRFDNVWIGIE